MLRRTACILLMLTAAGPAPQLVPRPVRVQAVTLVPQREDFTAAGVVQARTSADLAFRVGGKVVLRPVEIGDHVRSGQVLAQLDPADLQISQQATEAALRAAEADASNARIDLHRYDALGRGSPAYLPSEYDRRFAAERGAEARVAQAQHQVELARDQSAYGVLRADADGIVTALPVEAGQVVTSGQTVASVAHTDAIEVLADVPENRLAALRTGRDVSVGLWAMPGVVLHGRVRAVGALADAASRTFLVKIAVRDAPPASVALGMTATVGFHVDGPMVAVLPASALADRDGQPAVWVLDRASGHATLRPVSLAGFGGDGSVLVRGGLDAGEQVITAGVARIAPDMRLVAWDGANR